MALINRQQPITNDWISKQVKPPSYHAKLAGHHWLEIRDIDGHSFGIVVLQWNPGAQAWSHSGCVGTGFYVDTQYFVYVKECPIPE